MTDLYNGQITDLLNNAYRYDPEVIAFSYAKMQEQRDKLDGRTPPQEDGGEE